MSLDPRTRFGLAIGYAVWIALLPLAWTPVAFLPLAGVIGALGLGRAFGQWLRWVSVTLISWFVISWLATDVITALLAVVRLLAMFTTFFVFFRTTAAEDMANALVAMGVPYQAAFVFSAAMAFVPVLSRRAREVIDAQRARGIPIGAGWRGLPHVPALLMPLLVQAFTLSDQMAEALESRGFGREGRTFAREYRLRGLDWVALGLMSVVLVATGFFRG